jgi:hypothetical protein
VARHLALHTNIEIFDTKKRCCGPGSGRIGIILADPDPYPFQPNIQLKNTFFGIFSLCIQKNLNLYQNIENYSTYDADEQDKTMITGTAGNKIHFNSIQQIK